MMFVNLNKMEIIRSKVLPLPRKDIDTDLIIPADFLSRTTKEGYGEYLFDRLRKMEADFPFNLEKYQDAEVLVVRENFGCGSSREHAAWALADWGIKVVVAPSFGDIFFSNAMKNGILPIVLESELVEKIFAAGDIEVVVDLPKNTIEIPGVGNYEFAIDPYRKECLIKGIDDMDYLLEHMSDIAEFDREHAKHIFFDINKV
jgi:3-isopropylmalate/(R)-2-methylmalate dehydratase small subunit